MRKQQPNGKDKWIRAEFGGQPFKRLESPDFIDMYNHLMNGVDRFARITARIEKIIGPWKPLYMECPLPDDDL